MSTVYVVTTQTLESLTIHGVFLDRTVAEGFVSKWPTSTYSGDTPSIDEYSTEDDVAEYASDDVLWRVDVRWNDGEVIDTRQVAPDMPWNMMYCQAPYDAAYNPLAKKLNVYAWARSSEHAQAIAQQRYQAVRHAGVWRNGQWIDIPEQETI